MNLVGWTAVVVAALALTAGCAPDEPTVADRYVTEARTAAGSQWTDAELWQLSSIACSAPGSTSDKVTTLKAQRAALDFRGASGVVSAATKYVCPA